MTAYDLLTDSLISWRDTRGRRSVATLPGILAKLSSGELADFPSVQAHQLDPWCLFLTQLAAIGMRRCGNQEPSEEESDWASILLNLTDGMHEPWCLVVEDLSKPAFFQTSVPEGVIDAWKFADYPDDIDVLVTSKGHDVKQSRVAPDDIEAWLLAIATLQTAQGYSGGAGGYNGIARMKGGYGNRARIGCAPDLTLAGRFARDVGVLLALWERLLLRGFADSGAALLWTVPWDGTDSMEIAQLAPNFIEVCRRMRMVASPAGIKCRYTTSTTRRCLASDKTGDVGDPWIPIERADRGALTVGSKGFHYELLTQILFDGSFEPAAAQEVQSDDPDPVLFLASAMARGQGKTEGLHNRTLPLPVAARRRLGQADTSAALGRRASTNVHRAQDMRQKVLFPASMQLALGGQPVQDNFDGLVNEVFFEDLFRSLDEPDDAAQLEWDHHLFEIAWAELQRIVHCCSVPSNRWYRSVSEAESIFWTCLWKYFPTLARLISDRQVKSRDLL